MNQTAYNANNQLTTWGTANLFYDLNGNMTSDGTHSYTWDARNQLKQVDAGASANFVYDPFGRRNSKTIAGTTTTLLYDGSNAVQEIIGANTANSLMGGVDEVFQRTDSSGARSFLGDALGSTVALTDSTGAVQTSYSFDPFGSTSTGGAANSNTFAYTGRELDAANLNLYFYRARYYNPTLQRFISEDPIGFAGGDANLYAYVGNDPADSTDPSGLRKYHCDFFGNCYALPRHPIHGRQSCNRSADFLQLTGAAGPGLGPQATLSLDKYGHLYFGFGGQAGTPGASVSVTGNWLDQRANPTPAQLSNYLTKSNVSVSAGFGVGFQQGGWPGSGAATGLGYSTPQAGGSYTFSWDLGHVPGARW